MFDVALIICIILSIGVVILETSVSLVRLKPYLRVLEYLFTFFFTIEYLLRVYCSPKPLKYVFSFFGIIDLLSTLPLYVSWLFSSARYLIIVRTFRIIRVFRVFRLFSFLNEGELLLKSLYMSGKKICVFFLFVVLLVISMGTIMYMIEGNLPGTAFKDIPSSIYWAVVTLTTVGYGDITPVTSIGRFFSALVMLLGYTIIAVPTGIVSATIMQEQAKKSKKKCPKCGEFRHDSIAKFCKKCGEELIDNTKK
jgi:Ion transport protein.